MRVPPFCLFFLFVTHSSTMPVRPHPWYVWSIPLSNRAIMALLKKPSKYDDNLEVSDSTINADYPETPSRKTFRPLEW